MNIEYPGYNELEIFVKNNPKFLYEFTEYSYDNHERMRRIYEALNSDDTEDDIKETIKDIGEEIYAFGGMDALRGCFYMMVVAFRAIVKDTKSNKLIRQCQDHIHNLERYFDGIGEWKA